MTVLPGQMELATVINHSIDAPIIRSTIYPGLDQNTHKPAGIRLAKMLNKYDEHPSSELWREIQSLAWEITR